MKKEDGWVECIWDWVCDNHPRAYILGTALLWGIWSRLGGTSWRSGVCNYLLTLGVGALIDPLINPRNVLYGPALWRGDPLSFRVALTFDDGPHPVYTPKVLEVLAREEVKATFFLVGEKVRKYPEVARDILRAGHVIGNHTQNHVNLLLAAPHRAWHEIYEGRESIHEVLGVTPRWFRPPWGMRSPLTYWQVRSLAQEMALWTYAPRDWEEPQAELIAKRVLKRVGGGFVILLHDGGGDRSNTVAALKPMVRGIRAQGYKPVTLDEL